MQPRISQTDYNLYTDKKIDVPYLCYKYNQPVPTIYRHLSKFRTEARPAKRTWTQEEKEQIRQDLINSVPYDECYSVSKILARWGIPSQQQALQILKIKSLADLRLGENARALRALLRRYNLRLVRATLYAPKNRGMYHLDRQITVDLEELQRDPNKWFKENLDLINSVCYKTNEDTEPPKTASKKLLRRYDTATRTAEMLGKKYTTREIAKKLGTAIYCKPLRDGDEIFTEEELELLRRAGVIG
jgi:hypothetical protein